MWLDHLTLLLYLPARPCRRVRRNRTILRRRLTRRRLTWRRRLAARRVVTAITPWRDCVRISLADLREIAPSCVRASDGVYVPQCDLRQYERGERQFSAD